MLMSDNIRNAVEKLAEKYGVQSLKKASDALTATYASNKSDGARLVTTPEQAAVYAIVRMPATYAAVCSALSHSVSDNTDGFSTMLDVGAGTGAAYFAANNILGISHADFLEREPAMISVAKTLCSAEELDADFIKSDVCVFDPVKKYDLVTASYALNETDKTTREKILDKLILCTKKLLVIIEPGTPAAFSLQKEIRDYLKGKGAALIAPCPENAACRLPENDWCHFTCRVPRSKLHKLVKGGDVPYEDEKFTYSAFCLDGSISPCRSRILRHPLIEKGKITLSLCSEDGICSRTIYKSDKDLYKAARKSAGLSHDKRKHYIIPDGTPCDFLMELGVMAPDGRVYKKHYSKFRQINRFLEIADNCFEHLPDTGTLRIIDFGCGKSYLTFALYHYLRLIRGRDVDIIGLDLKEDVIAFCNDVAGRLGYDHLIFLTGDIADYESDGADMVVTLHACDTATDFALINAVRWHSKVILSVPCCQHELFSQIRSDINEPMLKHGIIKDKFTELLTDGLRGLKLEAAGYDVNMMEFTSLEHTSKNIMIKAVMTEKPDEAAMAKAQEQYVALRDFYHVSPAIDMLKTEAL